MAHVAFMWHLRDIIFGMYMTITCFLYHDTDCSIDDTIAFLLLSKHQCNVALAIPLILFNADANGIILTKKDVALHFNDLDLRNVMMPLITPSVSLDANASAHGITEPKRSYYTSFK